MIKINYIINFLIILIILIIYNFITNNIHPTLIIILILIYRISIRTLISMWSHTFIYSIILFLIIVRGLLIIFLYFSRLISNEKNTLHPNLFLNLLFIIIIILLLIFPLKTHFKFILNINLENNPLIYINHNIFYNILKIYTYPFNNFTFLCILYLIISLFSIIKICSIKYSSLRKIN